MSSMGSTLMGLYFEAESHSQDGSKVAKFPVLVAEDMIESVCELSVEQLPIFNTVVVTWAVSTILCQQGTVVLMYVVYALSNHTHTHNMNSMRYPKIKKQI